MVLPVVPTTLALGFVGVLTWLAMAASRRKANQLEVPRSVAIVVLGDIGRSPRMLYHASSFVKEGFQIHIVAYKGSTPPKELIESPLVKFVFLPAPLTFVSGLPKPLFLVLAPLKIVLGAWGLFWALMWRVDSPGFFLIQNPPAIPTLPVVKLASALRGTRVIIDWHNTGYSVLALRLGPSHRAVKFAQWIELYWGGSAYAHLCVTDAMRADLKADTNLKGHVVVFHDRPPAHFRRQAHEEKLELLSRLPVFNTPEIAAFLETSPTEPAVKLLVSATSWTADEDFTILIEALTQYQLRARALASRTRGDAGLPKVLVVITGKGAGKAEFERQVAELESEKGPWKWVKARTAWLALEDYPKLLGSADLGISLHNSTSGADLPMKVVDMFGCGLPVCALNFACISELVQDDVNGRVFNTANELAEQLGTLLRTPMELSRLGDGINDARYGAEQVEWGWWHESWARLVLPLLTSPNM